MTTSKGGRPATGQVKWLRTTRVRPPRYEWHARFTLNGKRTRWARLDPKGVLGLGEGDEDRARAQAQLVYQRALEQGAVPDYIEQTVREYAAAWLKDREPRVNSIRDDRGRLEHHVLPVVGDLDVRAFGREDVERMRDELDRDIERGYSVDAKGTRRRFSWITARNCWTVWTGMCADMVSSKRRELRVRDDNPCRDVRPPERGGTKAKQYLYPSEFLQLVSCEKVPLRWRRAAAIAVYTYTRDAELRVLEWGTDFDLEHGVLHVTRAYNRRKPAETKGTKSDTPRRFAVEANLLPLLRAMHEHCKGKGLVIQLPSERAMARNLRRWLWKAGVRRPALHDPTPTSKPLTWHDLRATGATWLAIRGDDPLKIRQRCGHADFATTERYIREAEAVRDGFGDVFPELPGCLLDPFGKAMPGAGGGLERGELGGSSEPGRGPSGSGSVSDTIPNPATVRLKTSPSGRGGRDSNATGEDARTPWNLAAAIADSEVVESEPTRTDAGSRHLAVVSSRLEHDEPELLTVAELERAIVDAVRMNLGEVARALASSLERRLRPENVIELATRRRS